MFRFVFAMLLMPSDYFSLIFFAIFCRCWCCCRFAMLCLLIMPPLRHY